MASRETTSRFSWHRCGLIETAATLVFVWLTSTALGGDTVPISVGAGLLITLVPAFIWLVFIYRQDRDAPEPPVLVLSTFGVGGILAWAIAQPCGEFIFQLGDWRYSTTRSQWVASLAIVATLQQVCAYLAVRLTVFHTTELDEPVDCIVYAVAGNLGVATATNLSFVYQESGLLPLAGTAWISSSTLIHVMAALPLGWGIFQLRIGNSPYRLGGYLCLSIIGNGCLAEVVRLVGYDGVDYRPWHLIGTTSVLAIGLLVIGGVVTARLRQSAPTAEPKHLQHPLGSSLALDLPVWILAILLLAGGLVFAKAQTPPATVIDAFDSTVRLTVPSGWSYKETADRVILEQVSLLRRSAHIHVESLSAAGHQASTPPATPSTDLFMLNLEQERRSRQSAFRTLRVEEKEAFGSQRSMWSHFAFLAEPPTGQDDELPVLMRGVDIVVTRGAAPRWLIRSSWPANAGELPIQKVLDSMRFTP